MEALEPFSNATSHRLTLYVVSGRSPCSSYWAWVDGTYVRLRAALVEISKIEATFTGCQKSVIDVAVTIGSFFWISPLMIKIISKLKANGQC